MQTSNPFVVRRPQHLDETHGVYNIYTPLYSRLYVFTRVRGIYIILSVCLVLQLSRTNYCGVHI